MAEGISLALTTEIAPAKLFTVDGAEYKLLGIDHLSAEDEAGAMALFARHSLLAQEIELTANTKRGAELALKLKSCRIRILCKLTTLPEEVATKLPVGAQVKLLEAIQVELSAEDADEDDDKEEDDVATADVATTPETRSSVLDGDEED
jgi:hypothetical protein